MRVQLKNLPNALYKQLLKDILTRKLANRRRRAHAIRQQNRLRQS